MSSAYFQKYSTLSAQKIIIFFLFLCNVIPSTSAGDIKNPLLFNIATKEQNSSETITEEKAGEKKEETSEAKPISHFSSIAELLDLESITKDRIAVFLDDTAKRLEQIPPDLKEDTTEGKIGTALKKRIEILKEFSTTVEDREGISLKLKTISEKIADLKKEIFEFNRSGPVKQPETPTQKELESLELKLNTQRDLLNRFKEELNLRAGRLEKIPELQNNYTAQISTIEKTIAEISNKLSEAKELSGKDLLTIQLENAKLENRTIKESLQLFNEEISFEKEFAPYRSQYLEYLQALVKRSEEEYNLYQAVMVNNLEKEKTSLQEEHDEKKLATETAKTQGEQFLASWEEKTAQININNADLSSRKVALSNMIIQLERRIQTEKDNFESLKQLVSKLGTSGKGGERIKKIYLRIKEIRKDPGKIFRYSVSESLATDRTNLFEVDELIFTVNDTWNQEFESTIININQNEKITFKTRALKSLDTYKNELIEEQGLLTDVISQETKLQNLGFVLNETFDEIEEFILPKLLWIRDIKPYGIQTPGYVLKEVLHLSGWARETISLHTLYSLYSRLKNPVIIFLAIVIFIVTPFFLINTRSRLKSFISKSGFPERKIVPISLVFLSTIRYPACLFLVAMLIRLLELPASLGEILYRFILHTVLFTFVWLLNRSLFSKNAITYPYVNLSPESIRSVFKFINTLLIAYIFLLAPSIILKGSPLYLDTVPRIGYTIFNIIALIGIFILIRKSSPLTQDIAGSKKTHYFFKYWTIISRFTMLILLSTIIMDALGFHFGACWIASGTLLSFTTVIILVYVHKTVTNFVHRVMKKRLKQITSAPGTEAQITKTQMEKQIHRFVKTFFVLLGVLLFVMYWGINEQVFSAFDKISLYNINLDPPEFISLTDIFRFIAIIAVTIWVLKNIPSILEISIFPRLKFDAGLRYALLTIFRYCIFLIGFIIALSAIHIDLTRIGWLMAAIGFGLGFGMQEIFSNFVSGLILLIERPVRVGDIVKAGESLGVVSRINIRATTITSFDRLENIIPNKDLITKAVTNWTLSDNITRLVIRIGVAYGSDIDLVRKILIDLAGQQPEILKDPAPSVFFMEHGDSTLNFDLRFFVSDLSSRLPLTDRMNTLINKELNARGIIIAFPQRDINIRVEDIQEAVKKISPFFSQQQDKKK